MELLRIGDMQGLDALIAERPSVVRHVLGRLWDLDAVVRERSAVAVGNVAAHHHELGVELMRRFAWALNDESATNGVFVIPAMAEVAVQAPELARPFVGQVVGALQDPGLNKEAERALELIRQRRPELVEQYEDEICGERGCGGRTNDQCSLASPENLQ